MKHAGPIAVLVVTGAIEGVVIFVTRQWNGEGAGIFVTIPNFLAVLAGLVAGGLSAFRGGDPMSAPAAGAVLLVPASLALYLTLGATINGDVLLVLAGSLFPLSLAAFTAYFGAMQDVEERRRRNRGKGASGYWEA